MTKRQSAILTNSTNLATTDTAQDITGVKTFTNGIKGRTDGGIPLTGYIGEKVTSTQIVTTTASSSSYTQIGSTLNLSVGTWMIVFGVPLYYAAATAVGNNGFTQVLLTNASNTPLFNSERIVNARTTSTSDAAKSLISVSGCFVETLSSATSILLQIKKFDTSGVGYGSAERSSGAYDAHFYAVRIA